LLKAAAAAAENRQRTAGSARQGLKVAVKGQKAHCGSTAGGGDGGGGGVDNVQNSSSRNRIAASSFRAELFLFIHILYARLPLPERYAGRCARKEQLMLAYESRPT